VLAFHPYISSGHLYVCLGSILIAMCFYYKKNPARSMRYKNRTQCFSWNLYYICKVLNGNLQNLNLAGRSRDITPELKNLKSKGKLGLLFMILPGLAYNIKMIRRRGS
jgi:hypothetical protein